MFTAIKHKYHPCSFLLPASLVFLVSCDNTLDPIYHTNYHFSIYGGLDLQSSEHVIRINDLSTPLDEHTSEPLDVTATLTNTETGEKYLLGKQVRNFDGHYVTNLLAEKDIYPETKYELAIEDADGRIARTTAISPPITQASGYHEGKYAECNKNIRLTFKPIQDVSLIHIRLGFEYDSQTFWHVPRLLNLDIEDEELKLDIVYEDILDELEDSPMCWDLEHDEMYVDFERYGPDWHEDETEIFENSMGKFGIYEDGFFTHPIDTVAPVDRPHR